MKIRIITVSSRLDDWLNGGFTSYSGRLPRKLRPELVEIPLAARRVPAVAIQREGEQILSRLQAEEFVVALDERGKAFSSAELAREFAGWQELYGRVAFLIGGPDGLADACRERANMLWSLSRLTLPHGLVRVLLAEQLYRAWSILQGHPYHRA